MKLANPRLAVTTILAIVLLSIGHLGTAEAQIVVGQTSFANEICGTAGLLLQTAVSSGASYEVPAGTFSIISWSADGGISGGPMTLNVFRPTGIPNTYVIVGESALETLAAHTLNTFGTNILVQGGDIVGIWGGNITACATGIPSSTDTFLYKATSANPPIGTTVTSLLSLAFSRINVSATLVALPTSVDECVNAGWQSFGFFRNQGDCISFVVTEGRHGPP
jgi:hypothetical protein